MSDPVLDALNAAAQRGGAAPAPGQPMSAPGAGVVTQSADPVLAALQQRSTQPDPAPAPTEPPRGLLQQTGDFLTATVHHAANLPWAAGQLATHVVAKPLSWLPDNPVSRGATWLANDFDKTVAQREATYQASTPNSTGAYAGATVGSIAPLLVGGVGGGVQGAGDAVAARVAPYLPRVIAPIGTKVVSGATQGAIVGATQPVTQPVKDGPLTLADLVAPDPQQQGSFWDQKADQIEQGATFGAAFPIATAPFSAAWNAGKRAVVNSPILNPSRYAANQVGIQLGTDAPSVATNLQTAPTYVPGSMPTSAQAGGNPALVMMEKSLANKSPTFQKQLQDRQINNNAARWDVINGVAQTPADLQAAIDARNGATGPMRDFTVTNGNPVPVAGVQSALSSLENGSLGVRPTIGGAAGSMRSAVDDFTTTTPPDTLTNTPGSSTAHPAMLDALRQNANDYLSKYAPNGVVGTQEQAAMTPIKSAIIDAINDANPGHKLNQGGWGKGLAQQGPEAPSYRDYLAEYIKRSMPINTMEVGQTLADQLGNKATDASGTPLLTLGNYSSRLAAALRGSPYAIDPAAQAALEGVQNDLQRATASSSIRAPGSDTAYNQGAGTTFLRSLGAADAGNGPAAAAGAATLAATGSAKTAGGVAFGTKKVGDFITNRVGNALGDLLLDPQKLAEALMQGSAPLSKQAPSAFGQLTGRVTPALRSALVAELLKAKAPQVVAPNQQKAEAYQP